MRYVYWKSLIILLPSILYAQIDTISIPIATTIRLEQFYDGEGVIFSSNSDTFPIMDDLRLIRFTPSIEDIIAAEKIIEVEIERQLGFNSKALEDCKRRLRKNYNRQYFGFLQPDGTKVIAIHYMDFTYRPFQFEWWKLGLISGNSIHIALASQMEWVNINKKIRYTDTLLKWN